MIEKPKKSRPKPIHPWSPGSVDPITYRPGPRDEDHEAIDKPTPIRESARIHGVRWYRDACGDDQIPGKCGEIFRYGISKLGVQIGGPRANGTQSKAGKPTVNRISEQYKWPICQGGENEIVFLVDECEIEDALEAVKAYRISKGPSCEVREKGIAAMEKYQFKTAENDLK